MNMTRKSFVDSFEENENILRKTKTKIFDLKENHQANKILSKQTHERTPRRRRQKFLGL